jgi:hypothetical protein
MEMKFTLTIELGNDAMQSYQDLRDALKQVATKLGSRQHCMKGTPSDGDGSKVMDENGNSVGEWKIEDEPEPDWKHSAQFMTEFDPSKTGPGLGEAGYCCLYHHTGGSKESSCGGDIATNI